MFSLCCRYTTHSEYKYIGCSALFHRLQVLTLPMQAPDKLHPKCLWVLVSVPCKLQSLVWKHNIIFCLPYTLQLRIVNSSGTKYEMKLTVSCLSLFHYCCEKHHDQNQCWEERVCLACILVHNGGKPMQRLQWMLLVGSATFPFNSGTPACGCHSLQWPVSSFIN